MDGGERTYISVIICTRNRGASLRRTLDSLLTPSNLARNDWELILVDNGSTDDTSRITSEYAAKFPGHVRTLMELRKGKSYALNSGIRAARGEILAFTDDDCEADANYLVGIRTVFEDPGVYVAQGRIVLELRHEPPWLTPTLKTFLAHLDHDNLEEAWAREPLLFGANMLLRRSAVARAGGFRTDLGPGTPAGFGEEMELSRRLLNLGIRPLWAPHVLIHHRPEVGRLRRRYYIKRFYRNGVSLARMRPANIDPPWWNPQLPAWRYKAYYAKVVVMALLRWAHLSLLGRSTEALNVLLSTAQDAGGTLELLRLRRPGVTESPVPKVLNEDGQPIVPDEDRPEAAATKVATRN